MSDPSQINFGTFSTGIPLPTYGNYGGRGYTGGQINGNNFSVPPVNDLDAIFRTHDQAYSQAGGNVSLLQAADQQMINSINTLRNTSAWNNLHPGDQIYADRVSDVFVALNAGRDVGAASGELIAGLREAFPDQAELLDLYEQILDEGEAQILDQDNSFCFLAGTQVDMWDGTKKPIEKITDEDIVLSHDKSGNPVPGRVRRTFQNTSKYILDFHGTMVTPGHAYYCAEGPYKGKHVPLIDILRTDGAVQKADGTIIRASTGGVVGKVEDKGFVWAVSGEQKGINGPIKVRQKGKLRLSTRIVLDEEGNNCSVADLIFGQGFLVDENDIMKKDILDPQGYPFFWRYTPDLPKPEDYILHMSAVTLEEIYRYGEAEPGFPFQMPPPVNGERGESFSGVPETLKSTAPSNIPLRMRKHVGTSTVFTDETTH